MVYTRLKVIVKFVVILVVLTTLIFRFSLQISQLMAKAIPVRGARFRKACF
ncbi:cytochrome c maturation protein CcmE [Salmonella bongori]|uniref:Cytochrome c maturation protein CcmE n=1 Tax=Salmonella bongori TaxID=54736 RepID=A0A698VXD8_SALBN|nr:cytochrome c maturation protein CcmE [Salmonella bongori]EDP8608508.1 cytochrome c maturation protein CcmE [Salmonella bongori]EDP8651533.1 cytochrome c maturation protein CcmE [Salmonella bongori]